jgi:hypothetical protein
LDTQPAFNFENLFRFALGDMAKAMSERTGETEAQQFARCQATAHLIMGFLPRDVIELMLAGHCVMLHETMKADIHDNLCGEAGTNRRTLIALNKAFNDDLDRLERCRQPSAEGSPDVPEVPPIANAPDVPVADAPPAPVASVAKPDAPALSRAARRQAARAEMRAAAAASRAASRRAVPMPPRTACDALPAATPRHVGTTTGQPAHEAVAKCRANVAAMTASAAGDAAGFARALSVAPPHEAFLIAAKTPGSPFDPQGTGPWPPEHAAGAHMT